MWVIVLNRGLNQHRDNRISEIMGESITKEYLSKRNGSKVYYTTSNIQWAQIFKTESGALRVINEFNLDTDKSRYYNKFNWVKDRVMSIYKMTREEYEQSCDVEISRLNNKYNKQLAKLTKKKSEYK
jgi:hypothetical protein